MSVFGGSTIVSRNGTIGEEALMAHLAYLEKKKKKNLHNISNQRKLLTQQYLKFLLFQFVMLKWDKCIFLVKLEKKKFLKFRIKMHMIFKKL